MPVVSEIYPGELIIDDLNAPPPLDPIIGNERKGRGRIAHDRIEFGFCKQFDLQVIPRSQWRERILHLEETKSRISDHLDQAGLTVLDQNGTNFCWANAPTHCVEINRVLQGHQMIRLSPASVACPIKGFRNQGGWGGEALEYIIKNGVAPQSVWPANAIDRKLLNEESKKQGLNFRVLEWYQLADRSFEQLMTCVLLGIPIAIGLNWWSHEVTAIDGVVLEGNKFGIRIDNSWGTGWSDKGRGILTESKATPDDAVGPRVVYPFN